MSTSIKETFAQLMSEPLVKAGLAFIEADQPRSIEEQKTIVQIEAPTFNEASRAADYAERLSDLGLVDVHVDSYGNVLGRRPGKGGILCN